MPRRKNNSGELKVVRVLPEDKEKIRGYSVRRHLYEYEVVGNALKRLDEGGVGEKSGD
jgi:hypothetical protein